MNKKYVIGSLFSLLVGLSFSQDPDNLVPNPGFEGTKGKLKNIKQIHKATDWHSPTGLRADLFSATVRNTPVSVPDNKYGREQPLEGNNYAGITVYSYNNRLPRTYILTTLTQKLKKGQKYCVKFNVSLSDLSKYAVNNIGAHITKKPIEIDGKENIVFKKGEPVVKIKSNRIFNGRYNWETVCGVFEAEGKEQYLIIGNFDETKDTKYKKLKKKKDTKGSQLPLAYYYIDDVSVIPLTDENKDICICEKEDKEEVERIIYRKQQTSMDGFSDEEKINNSTIYFDHLKSELEPDAKGDLDQLAGVLIENSSYKVKIVGHSTKEETTIAKEEEFHEDLAKRRIQKTVEYLKSHGLDESKFETEIMDDLEPASNGDTQLDEAKNRRVEFKLVN